MAFKKTVQLASGYPAEYFRLVRYELDYEAKTLSATFRVFKDEASAKAGSSPATHQEVRLRLEQVNFDRYFSKESKKIQKELGISIEAEAIIYRAARDEPVIADPDFGAIVNGYCKAFNDATDA